jgi:hypothetical protein
LSRQGKERRYRDRNRLAIKQFPELGREIRVHHKGGAYVVSGDEYGKHFRDLGTLQAFDLTRGFASECLFDVEGELACPLLLIIDPD